MKALLVPGFMVLNRLSLGWSFILLGLLFTTPAAVGQTSSRESVLQLGIWVPLLAGLYLLGCLYLWTSIGALRQAETLEKIASGDLTGRITAGQSVGAINSEASRMWLAAKRMRDSLVEIVNQVRASSDAIATGAKEIAAGNASLSQRTEEQASSLQATASGMEQFGATVKQNAEHCRRASELARGTSEVAARAAEVLREATNSMAEIEASSKRVAEITGMIEGIAFQTNILALNAAVEAARAGQQGRGFAVVATEVRSLAQLSADATKGIKELIGASADQVAQGSRLVSEAGETMAKALESVQTVTSLIDEIAVASAEQSEGVEEINSAIGQLDSVTQRNAALAEQATALAVSFEDEASRLVAVVSTFKVDDVRGRDGAVVLVEHHVGLLDPPTPRESSGSR